MRNKFTYLFARQDRHGIDAAAVLTIEVLNPSEDKTQESVLQLFCAAVTDWLNKTDEGREAYAESVENFNIGDALNGDILCKQSFLNYCQHYGIVINEMTGLDHDSTVEYDKLLNLDPPDE